MRIGERASLKHRNASKYLQLQAKRAKFDKASKTNLNEQLSMHRGLLAKHGEKFGAGEEQEEEEEEDTTGDIDLTKAPKPEESFAEFSGSVKKFWSEEQARRQEEAKEKLEEAFDEAQFELRRSNERKIAAMKRRLDGTAVEEEEAAEEDPAEKDELVQADSLNFKVRPSSDEHLASLGSTLGKELAAREASLPNVDPAKFIEPTVIQGQDLPEIQGYNEEEEEASQQDLIAEAFADDDVVDDFKAEKAALVAASKPKAIDLTLPGWGEWGGGGARPSKRKRKRFTVKAPPAPKRRDENNQKLIINTSKDEKIRAHQVSSIPFPLGCP